MAKLSRVALVKTICQKVGISQRTKPENQYLSKYELLRISGFLDLAAATVKEKEQQEQKNRDKL